MCLLPFEGDLPTLDTQASRGESQGHCWDHRHPAQGLRARLGLWGPPPGNSTDSLDSSGRLGLAMAPSLTPVPTSPSTLEDSACPPSWRPGVVAPVCGHPPARDHLPQTQVHHLPGGLPPVVKAIEREGPLLAVVLHRDIALQGLHMGTEAGRSARCAGTPSSPHLSGKRAPPRSPRPCPGRLGGQCGTSASFRWCRRHPSKSPNYLVPHHQAVSAGFSATPSAPQSQQTLRACTSFVVTPPTG